MMLTIIFLTIVVQLQTVLAVTGEFDLIKCETYDDCRAACGFNSQSYKCNSKGYCSCLNIEGSPGRCRQLRTQDGECKELCGYDRLSRRCQTDAGEYCSCFQIY